MFNGLISKILYSRRLLIHYTISLVNSVGWFGSCKSRNKNKCKNRIGYVGTYDKK